MTTRTVAIHPVAHRPLSREAYANARESCTRKIPFPDAYSACRALVHMREDHPGEYLTVEVYVCPVAPPDAPHWHHGRPNGWLNRQEAPDAVQEG